MLQTMRKTVQKTGLIDGGHAENIYTSMLDQEYAKLMASNNRSSLSEALYNQLKPKNAVKNNAILNIIQ